jgi:hypothetical protein
MSDAAVAETVVSIFLRTGLLAPSMAISCGASRSMDVYSYSRGQFRNKYRQGVVSQWNNGADSV